MAIRVYRVAVVGCPRAVITEDTSFDGVGKSCLCNRFVRPEAYSESHRSLLSEADWSELTVFNRDHFVYWGAATKHLQDGSKVRFQIVEQTEFYDSGTTEKLRAHQAKENYISRALALRFSSQSGGKVAYKLQAELGGRNGRLIRATQLFPSEDFSSKSGHGVYGFVCVFDPSLEGEEMKRQLDYLAELLHELGKKKRKVVLACVKCDAVDETKIRHASNLAISQKKPIPFLEVSAREGVNVDEAFFSIICPPKKRRAPKSSKRSSTGYLTYREIVSLRKHDLNRARDAYRRLLQRKVTDFSCVWSEVFPALEREQEFSLVLQLGGKEGKEIVKKMFCLRLIEIKLMEASKRFGFSSARKKLDKDQSRSHQVYLSEAFKGHPDLGTESLYDYVYSPGASLAGDGFGSSLGNESSSEYTEPSTPTTYSSSRTTPDCMGISPTPYSAPPSGRYSLLPPPRPRSATHSHNVLHIPDDGSSSYDSSTLPISASKNASADQLLVSTKHFSYHGEAEPPPLPYRGQASPMSESLRKDDGTTKSQSFLDFSSPEILLQKEGEARRLSNSMDPLLVPKDDKSATVKTVGDLNAEPYLQPFEVQQVMVAQMGALPPIPVLPPTPEKRESNASLFRSMRLPKLSQRPPLPRPESSQVDQSLVSRTNSLKARGHRRSHSNPWILESSIDVMSPPVPPVPPRTSDIPPPVPPRDTPKHRMSKTPPPSVYTDVHQMEITNPIESSLDYRDGTLPRSFPQAPFTPQKRVSIGREGEDNDDNASDISGPFEEIDEPTRNIEDESERAGSPSDVSIVSKSQSLALSISEDRSDDLNNQYAKIDEFQHYLPMAPAASATLPLNRGATFPPQHSPSHDDADGRRERSVTMTHPYPFGHHASAPVMHAGRDRAKTLIGRWKKFLRETSIHESDESSLSDAVSSTYLQSTPKRFSQIDPHRPLPPSPTKILRTNETLSKKASSGSNIYEVIDEDYLTKVRNKKQVQGEEDIPEFVPPVDPQYSEKYLEIVQRFFNIPEVRDHWISSVRTVIPEADPSDFPPPFYSPPIKETAAELQDTETEPQPTPPEPEELAAVSKVKAAVSMFESTTGRTTQSSPANKLKKQVDDRTLVSKSPQPSTERPNKQDEDRTSVSKSSQSLTEKKQDDDRIPVLPRGAPVALASSTPTSPAAHRLRRIAAAKSTHSTPLVMARSSSSNTPHVLKKMGSRDNMIEFLNRTLNQSESSDSESGDSDTESETDQFDRQADPGKEEVSQPSVPQLNGVIVQTDLDTAVMRPSISTDSDFVSDTAKSPQSNSVEEVNHVASGGEPSGGIVVVPRRSSPRRKGDLGEARNLIDSGISNLPVFDDELTEQNFESDC